VTKEFDEHASEEQEHMRAAAERINQLGGPPDFKPEGLATRSASQYAARGNLPEMIKENLIAERIASEHYRELIRFFSDKLRPANVVGPVCQDGDQGRAIPANSLLASTAHTPSKSTK
jgi:bacterioferritin